MRFVLAMVLAGLAALPLSAGAQTGQEGTDSEPNLHEPAPEEPALQLKLDAAGVEAVPSQPRTVDEYTLEEIELRIRRARIGLLSTTGVLVVGAALSLVGAATSSSSSNVYEDPLVVTGLSILVGGTVGMIASGIVLGVRNRELRRFKPMGPGVRRARIGLLSTTGVFLFGGMLIGIGAPQLDLNTGEGGVLLWTGFALASGGIVGMMTTGGMLARRKRKQRELQEAHYGTPAAGSALRNTAQSAMGPCAIAARVLSDVRRGLVRTAARGPVAQRTSIAIDVHTSAFQP
jgi:hypothetical protein